MKTASSTSWISFHAQRLRISSPQTLRGLRIERPAVSQRNLRNGLSAELSAFVGSSHLVFHALSRPFKNCWIVYHVPDIEVFPAFDYARMEHTTTVLQQACAPGASHSKVVTFHSEQEKLQLDLCIDNGGEEGMTGPSVNFKKVHRNGMKGEGVVANVTLREGQSISFIIRQDLEDHITSNITTAVLDSQQHDTQLFWYNWLSKSLYKGAWREVVSRSLMILKMLTVSIFGCHFYPPSHRDSQRASIRTGSIPCGCCVTLKLSRIALNGKWNHWPEICSMRPLEPSLLLQHFPSPRPLAVFGKKTGPEL